MLCTKNHRVSLLLNEPIHLNYKRVKSFAGFPVNTLSSAVPPRLYRELMYRWCLEGYINPSCAGGTLPLLELECLLISSLPSRLASCGTCVRTIKHVQAGTGLKMPPPFGVAMMPLHGARCWWPACPGAAVHVAVCRHRAHGSPAVTGAGMRGKDRAFP